MNTQKKLSGAAIAAAAAGLLLSGAVLADSHMGAEAKVHCYGINACKGKTACATADNACKGQNSCKGKGWIEMSAAECKEKGGSVMK